MKPSDLPAEFQIAVASPVLRDILVTALESMELELFEIPGPGSEDDLPTYGFEARL